MVFPNSIFFVRLFKLFVLKSLMYRSHSIVCPEVWEVNMTPPGSRVTETADAQKLQPAQSRSSCLSLKLNFPRIWRVRAREKYSCSHPCKLHKDPFGLHCSLSSMRDLPLEEFPMSRHLQAGSYAFSCVFSDFRVEFSNDSGMTSQGGREGGKWKKGRILKTVPSSGLAKRCREGF